MALISRAHKRLAKGIYKKAKKGLKSYSKPALAGLRHFGASAGASAYNAVHGMKKVQKKLAQLQRASANRVMRKAIGEGTKIISKTAKKLAPIGKGPTRKLLQKSIGRKTKTYTTSGNMGAGTVIGIVGPRSKQGKTIGGRFYNPTRYGHIAERGRGEVKVKKKRVLSDGSKFYGKKVKSYSGQPFMGPALSSNRSQVFAAMARAAWTGIAAELAKNE